jgi:phosphatidyl-myo-inositol dimannoside synthase
MSVSVPHTAAYPVDAARPGSTSRDAVQLLDGTAPAVVIVTERFPPGLGGSGVLLENVYKRLGGLQPTVLTEVPKEVVGSPSRAFRYVHIPIAGDHWGITRLSSLARRIRLAWRLQRECAARPAIVHCGRALPEGLAALLVRRLFGGPPYLCWTHGEELEYLARSRELKFLLSLVHRGAAAVVANCRNTARQLASAGVPADKIHVVYPGVDVARFSSGTSHASVRSRFAGDGELLMLTVGRLQRRKGHDLALRALARLRDMLPNLRYVIVGDGQERPRLERCVAEARLEDRVHFVGAVQDEELPGYYAAADLFVHPNRVHESDVEGFGIVFLEAAAAGVPTIGGRSGGVPEAIEEGVTGLLVSGEDEAELAAAIRSLADSAPLRRRMGDAGRARASRLFTWERAAAQIAAIHRSLSPAS